MSDRTIVSELPQCDFGPETSPAEETIRCRQKARYDFRTKLGPWANGCEAHWIRYRVSEKLGTGLGQRLVLYDDVEGEKLRAQKRMCEGCGEHEAVDGDDLCTECARLVAEREGKS